MKKLWNRESLKNFFRKGQLPSEIHFSYLIDSTVNKLDDGFAKNDKDGLRLAPTGSSDNLISVFKDLAEQYPSWQISLHNDEKSAGLSFGTVRENADNSIDRKSRLFLSNNGNIGINTDTPRMQMEVNGTLGMRSRVGAFLVGKVPGDGQWHDVVAQLDGMQAFEVTALIEGQSGRGKYAMTHAIALSTFGGSRNRIKQVRAHFGWFWNRIDFRWHGSVHDYSLQVRTRSHYGLTQENTNYMIRFHVTQLWDDAIFQQV